MRRLARALAIVLVGALASTATFAASNKSLVEEGKKIFTTKKLGNCTACHSVNGLNVNSSGTLGPKLVGLKYVDEKTLYDMVYDIYATQGIKVTAMPPFGRNGWLSDEQIKAVVAFLKTIE